MMKFLGLGIIVMGEIALWQNVYVVTLFFTPIAWTGYIIFVDSLVYERTGQSLIRTRTREFLWMIPFSIIFWMVFEWYNWIALFNWDYINLPPLPLFVMGCLWAFGTVWPAILETYDLLVSFRWFEGWRLRRPWHLTPGLLWCIGWFGLICVSVPLMVPIHVAGYLGALIWVGFVLLLDPVNCWLGWPSILGDLARGEMSRLGRLWVAGLICGILWEFWNYWAVTKWIYTVPGVLGAWKIFEMPVLGYLGFLAFGVEVWVMWKSTWGVLQNDVLQKGPVILKPSVGVSGN